MNASFDEFPGGGPRFLREGAYSIGTDAVLLADFAKKPQAARVCDLGCGSGVVAILLLLADGRKSALGVEIDAEAVRTAEANARENGLGGRFEAVAADLRAFRAPEYAGAFDLTVSNPPYYKEGSGKKAPEPGRARARGEEACTLRDVCAAAAYLTRWGGSFCMVHKPERLSEALCSLTAAGLEPKRLRFVEARAGSSPGLFLVDARRGGKPGLVIEPPLVLIGEDGRETEEVRRIYGRQEEKEAAP